MIATTLVLKLGVLFLLLTAFKCDDNSDAISCEDKIVQLDKMKTEIQELAEHSVCNENSECRFMAFGSKPCGGPWSYLVYSTSIDTTKLTALVEAYNTVESQLNQDCGRVSDCAMVNPPEGLECKDGKCIAFFNRK